MTDVETFLAHAIHLECDAARRYEDLAAAMRTEGNRELAAFFAQMAGFSRLHLADAIKRAGFRDVPMLAPDAFAWPDGMPPETADWAGVDAQLDVATALALALDNERRGHAYYAAIAALATDPELRRLADTFAQEEASHVAELEKRQAAAAAGGSS